MELDLHRETYRFSKEILNMKMLREETAEMIVPNSKPDILQVLSTTANVCLHSKTAAGGKVTVSGSAETVILYLPDDGSAIQRMTVEIPFTAETACPDACDETDILASVELASADCRLLNPRKIMARVNVQVWIACYRQEEWIVPSGTECPGVEILRGSRETAVYSRVWEKTFAVGDEFTITGSKQPVGELLRADAELSCDDVKAVGSKLIFRGSVRVHTLYKTLESGDAESADFQTEFSQIMEIENAQEGTEYEIMLSPTGIYFNDDSMDRRTISMELHAVAQCRACRNMTIPFIADCYCPRFEMKQQCRTLELCTLKRGERMQETVREMLDAGAGVRSVLDVSAQVGEVLQHEGSCRVSCRLTALYVDEKGQIGAASRSCSVELPPQEGVCREMKRSGDLFATVTGQGIEVRFTLSYVFDVRHSETVSLLEAASWDEESPVESAGMPSLILLWPERGETVWSLAKRFRSSRMLICRSNGLEEEEGTVPPGKMLVIPKMR